MESWSAYGARLLGLFCRRNYQYRPRFHTETRRANIFEDLGFANAEEKLAKVKLASVIYDLITEKGLSQQEVSQILGIDEAKISNLKNGRLQKFSLEQMFSFLVALGQNIEILVTPQAVANSSVSIQVMYRNKS